MAKAQSYFDPNEPLKINVTPDLSKTPSQLKGGVLKNAAPGRDKTAIIQNTAKPIEKTYTGGGLGLLPGERILKKQEEERQSAIEKMNVSMETPGKIYSSKLFQDQVKADTAGMPWEDAQKLAINLGADSSSLVGSLVDRMQKQSIEEWSSLSSEERKGYKDQYDYAAARALSYIKNGSLYDEKKFSSLLSDETIASYYASRTQIENPSGFKRNAGETIKDIALGLISPGYYMASTVDQAIGKISGNKQQASTAQYKLANFMGDVESMQKAGTMSIWESTESYLKYGGRADLMPVFIKGGSLAFRGLKDVSKITTKSVIKGLAEGAKKELVGSDIIGRLGLSKVGMSTDELVDAIVKSPSLKEDYIKALSQKLDVKTLGKLDTALTNDISKAYMKPLTAKQVIKELYQSYTLTDKQALMTMGTIAGVQATATAIGGSESTVARAAMQPVTTLLHVFGLGKAAFTEDIIGQVATQYGFSKDEVIGMGQTDPNNPFYKEIMEYAESVYKTSTLMQTLGWQPESRRGKLMASFLDTAVDFAGTLGSINAVKRGYKNTLGKIEPFSAYKKDGTLNISVFADIEKKINLASTVKEKQEAAADGLRAINALVADNKFSVTDKIKVQKLFQSSMDTIRFIFGQYANIIGMKATAEIDTLFHKANEAIDMYNKMDGFNAKQSIELRDRIKDMYSALSKRVSDMNRVDGRDLSPQLSEARTRAEMSMAVLDGLRRSTKSLDVINRRLLKQSAKSIYDDGYRILTNEGMAEFNKYMEAVGLKVDTMLSIYKTEPLKAQILRGLAHKKDQGQMIRAIDNIVSERAMQFFGEKQISPEEQTKIMPVLTSLIKNTLSVAFAYKYPQEGSATRKVEGPEGKTYYELDRAEISNRLNVITMDVVNSLFTERLGTKSRGPLSKALKKLKSGKVNQAQSILSKFIEGATLLDGETLKDIQGRMSQEEMIMQDQFTETFRIIDSVSKTTNLMQLGESMRRASQAWLSFYHIGEMVSFRPQDIETLARYIDQKATDLDGDANLRPEQKEFVKQKLNEFIDILTENSKDLVNNMSSEDFIGLVNRTATKMTQDAVQDFELAKSYDVQLVKTKQDMDIKNAIANNLLEGKVTDAFAIMPELSKTLSLKTDMEKLARATTQVYENAKLMYKNSIEDITKNIDNTTSDVEISDSMLNKQIKVALGAPKDFVLSNEGYYRLVNLTDESGNRLFKTYEDFEGHIVNEQMGIKIPLSQKIEQFKNTNPEKARELADLQFKLQKKFYIYGSPDAYNISEKTLTFDKTGNATKDDRPKFVRKSDMLYNLEKEYTPEGLQVKQPSTMTDGFEIWKFQKDSFAEYYSENRAEYKGRDLSDYQRIFAEREGANDLLIHTSDGDLQFLRLDRNKVIDEAQKAGINTADLDLVRYYAYLKAMNGIDDISMKALLAEDKETLSKKTINMHKYVSKVNSDSTIKYNPTEGIDVLFLEDGKYTITQGVPKEVDAQDGTMYAFGKLMGEIGKYSGYQDPWVNTKSQIKVNYNGEGFALKGMLNKGNDAVMLDLLSIPENLNKARTYLGDSSLTPDGVLQRIKDSNMLVALSSSVKDFNKGIDGATKIFDLNGYKINNGVNVYPLESTLSAGEMIYNLVKFNHQYAQSFVGETGRLINEGLVEYLKENPNTIDQSLVKIIDHISKGELGQAQKYFEENLDKFLKGGASDILKLGMESGNILDVGQAKFTQMMVNLVLDNIISKSIPGQRLTLAAIPATSLEKVKQWAQQYAPDHNFAILSRKNMFVSKDGKIVDSTGNEVDIRSLSTDKIHEYTIAESKKVRKSGDPLLINRSPSTSPKGSLAVRVLFIEDMPADIQKYFTYNDGTVAEGLYITPEVANKIGGDFDGDPIAIYNEFSKFVKDGRTIGEIAYEYTKKVDKDPTSWESTVKPTYDMYTKKWTADQNAGQFSDTPANVWFMRYDSKQKTAVASSIVRGLDSLRYKYFDVPEEKLIAFQNKLGTYIESAVDGNLIKDFDSIYNVLRGKDGYVELAFPNLVKKGVITDDFKKIVEYALFKAAYKEYSKYGKDGKPYYIDTQLQNIQKSAFGQDILLSLKIVNDMPGAKLVDVLCNVMRYNVNNELNILKQKDPTLADKINESQKILMKSKTIAGLVRTINNIAGEYGVYRNVYDEVLGKTKGKYDPTKPAYGTPEYFLKLTSPDIFKEIRVGDYMKLRQSDPQVWNNSSKDIIRGKRHKAIGKTIGEYKNFITNFTMIGKGFSPEIVSPGFKSLFTYGQINKKKNTEGIKYNNTIMSPVDFINLRLTELAQSDPEKGKAHALYLMAQLSSLEDFTTTLNTHYKDIYDNHKQFLAGTYNNPDWISYMSDYLKDVPEELKLFTTDEVDPKTGEKKIDMVKSRELYTSLLMLSQKGEARGFAQANVIRLLDEAGISTAHLPKEFGLDFTNNVSPKQSIETLKRMNKLDDTFANTLIRDQDTYAMYTAEFGNRATEAHDIVMQETMARLDGFSNKTFNKNTANDTDNIVSPANNFLFALYRAIKYGDPKFNFSAIEPLKKIIADKLATSGITMKDSKIVESTLINLFNMLPRFQALTTIRQIRDSKNISELTKADINKKGLNNMINKNKNTVHEMIGKKTGSDLTKKIHEAMAKAHDLIMDDPNIQQKIQEQFQAKVKPNMTYNEVNALLADIRKNLLRPTDASGKPRESQGEKVPVAEDFITPETKEAVQQVMKQYLPQLGDVINKSMAETLSMAKRMTEISADPMAEKKYYDRLYKDILIKSSLETSAGPDFLGLVISRMTNVYKSLSVGVVAGRAITEGANAITTWIANRKFWNPGRVHSVEDLYSRLGINPAEQSIYFFIPSEEKMGGFQDRTKLNKKIFNIYNDMKPEVKKLWLDRVSDMLFKAGQFVAKNTYEKVNQWIQKKLFPEERMTTMYTLIKDRTAANPKYKDNIVRLLTTEPHKLTNNERLVKTQFLKEVERRAVSNVKEQFFDYTDNPVFVTKMESYVPFANFLYNQYKIFAKNPIAWITLINAVDNIQQEFTEPVFDIDGDDVKGYVYTNRFGLPILSALGFGKTIVDFKRLISIDITNPQFNSYSFQKQFFPTNDYDYQKLLDGEHKWYDYALRKIIPQVHDLISPLWTGDKQSFFKRSFFLVTGMTPQDNTKREALADYYQGNLENLVGKKYMLNQLNARRKDKGMEPLTMENIEAKKRFNEIMFGDQGTSREYLTANVLSDYIQWMNYVKPEQIPDEDSFKVVHQSLKSYLDTILGYAFYSDSEGTGPTLLEKAKQLKDEGVLEKLTKAESNMFTDKVNYLADNYDVLSLYQKANQNRRTKNGTAEDKAFVLAFRYNFKEEDARLVAMRNDPSKRLQYIKAKQDALLAGTIRRPDVDPNNIEGTLSSVFQEYLDKAKGLIIKDFEQHMAEARSINLDKKMLYQLATSAEDENNDKKAAVYWAQFNKLKQREQEVWNDLNKYKPRWAEFNTIKGTASSTMGTSKSFMDEIEIYKGGSSYLSDYNKQKTAYYKKLKDRDQKANSVFTQQYGMSLDDVIRQFNAEVNQGSFNIDDL